MSLTRRENGRIHGELDALARVGILRGAQVVRLKERYPTTAADFIALVRAFTVLGALTAVAGLVVLVRNHLDWWLVSESGLALAGVGLLALGRWLRVGKALPALGDSAELVGGMALQGLTTVLAVHYSTGSKDWPALVGVQTVLLTVLAYGLANRLLLWYACIVFFFWFGAETGYVAGWGCYWLGMTYPVRFLAVGVATLLLAGLHASVVRGRWAGFSRVYAHYGLLVTNLALWFLALFGYYEKYDIRWSDTETERLLFSLLWAAVAGGSLYAGARLGLRLARGYGLTFLIINVYTFYFQFVAVHTGEAWFLHLLLVGGSLLGLGVYLERRRRDEVAPPTGDLP